MYLLAINSLPRQPLTMNFLAKMRFVNCRSFVKIKVGFMHNNHSEANTAKTVRNILIFATDTLRWPPTLHLWQQPQDPTACKIVKFKSYPSIHYLNGVHIRLPSGMAISWSYVRPNFPFCEIKKRLHTPFLVCIFFVQTPLGTLGSFRFL